MADTAFQIQYRQEFVAGFEQAETLMRKTVTSEAVIKGNQAVFLVADSGGAVPVTRGVNGLIPARPDNLTQNTATLTENHDLVEKTGFNIFASQGDGRKIMQMTSMGVINRGIDQQILTALANTTYAAGVAATTGSLAMVAWAKTILGNNQVPLDGNISAVITPAFHGYLMQVKEFANAQYVNDKPFENQPVMFRWYGVNFIVHNNLVGVGTASESCYMYHRSAIGHAVNSADLQSLTGYDEKQDYSWARTTIFMGAKLLQAKGVVLMRHDGSAFAATA